MKKRRYLLVPIAALILNLPTIGQLDENSVRIHLRAQDLIVPAGTIELEEKNEGVVNGRIYRYVQFYHTPNSQERYELEVQGWRFLNYLSEHTYLVSLPGSFTSENMDLNAVRAVLIGNYLNKMHPHLIEGPYPDHAIRNGRLLVELRAQKDIVEAQLLSLCRTLDVQAISKRGATVLLKENELLKVAENPWVHWMEFISEPGTPEDTPGRSLHRSNVMFTEHALGRKYNGEGVSVAVNDDGFVGPHIDFKGRTNQQDVLGDMVGDHGDMTTGIVGGAGNMDPNIRGMAPGSHIHVRQYSSSMGGIEELHQDSSVMIFSTSYSNGCNAGYTTTTELVDEEIFNNNSLLQVFSAGNSNNQNCGYGAGNQWGNVTGGHKIGKNVIATANLTADDVLVNSSSRGPASDGRLKPDISANGNGQLSTDPFNNYNPGGGTSAAAPGIAGVMVQLYHAYRDLNNGNDPNSGLMKACLLNTADDLGNPGPDFKFGWGRVNALNAVRTLEDVRYQSGTVDQGLTAFLSLNVPANTARLKVMLYWLEPAASTQAALALVNDLDFEVIDPGATVHLPLVLDNTPDPNLLDLPAVPGKDHLNNVEQVVIDNPMAGVYSLNIEGFDVPFGPQEFYVVYEFVQNDIELIYPIGGEGFIPNEQEWIRWDAYNEVDDITLEFSGDLGATWSTINTVSGNERFLQWNVPDSLTGRALVRVSQNGTSDQSDTTFSIIRPPQGMEVIWQCTDSLLFAWQAHPDAVAYIPYYLGQRFMEPVATTSDTSVVMYGFIPNVVDYFSVEAIGADGAKSRRAIAYEKPLGLIDCVVAKDLTTIEVLQPAAAAMNCQSDDNVVVVALVQNIGTDTIFSWNSHFNLNGGPVTSIPVSVTLAPGDSAVVEFPPTDLTVGSNTFNALNVWTELATDDYPYNDTAYGGIQTFGSQVFYPWSSDLEELVNCASNSACLGQVCDVGPKMVNAENGLYDDMDWRVDSAGTPTSGTGPDVDHTLGTEQGHYVYLESSGGCSLQSAHLITPCMELPTNTNAAFSFWYNMFGEDQGELHVDIMVDMLWEMDIIPPIIGEQGNGWIQAYAWLGNYGGERVNLRIRGITGPSNKSDLALDDINIDMAVGINEHVNGNGISVHPNPSNGLYTLELGRTGLATLEVFDMSGKRLVQRTVSERTTTIDLSNMPAGIYTLQVRGQKNVDRLRLVRL